MERRLTIRFLDEELAQLHQLADREGVSASDHVRSSVRGRLRRETSPASHAEDCASVIAGLWASIVGRQLDVLCSLTKQPLHSVIVQWLNRLFTTGLSATQEKLSNSLIREQPAEGLTEQQPAPEPDAGPIAGNGELSQRQHAGQSAAIAAADTDATDSDHVDDRPAIADGWL